ncbi:MAG: helix-turn-helix domain-containing protein [Candidatus Limnocylindria bacterium]
MTLVNWADDDGRGFPSNKTLAEAMKVNVKNVKRRIRRAVASGWLVIEHQGRWKGDPNRYRITPQGCAHSLKAPNDGGLRSTAKGVTRDPLTATPKGYISNRKGVHIEPQRGSHGTPERIERSNDGAEGAPFSRTAPSSPIEVLAPPLSRTCPGCGRDFLGEGYGGVCSRRCEQTIGGVAS